MSHFKTSTIAFVLAAFPATAWAGSDRLTNVWTAQPEGSIHIAVQVKDLDLTSAKGIETLNVRVQNAAKAGCEEAYSGDKWSRLSQPRCMRMSIKSAEQQADRAIEVARANMALNAELALAPQQ